jgi:hypothetical protein
MLLFILKSRFYSSRFSDALQVSATEFSNSIIDNFSSLNLNSKILLFKRKRAESDLRQRIDWVNKLCDL